MKKTTLLFLLFAVAAIFAGCSRDTGIEDGLPVRKVTYSINGETMDIVLRGDAEWDDFIVMLFDKVGEGFPVVFQCTGTTYEPDPPDTKRPLTFKTADRNEARKWASEHGKQGYVVIVSYDKRNKLYKLQAVKK